MALTVDDVISAAPVLPVVQIDDIDDAVPLAHALVTGGLPAMEIMLGTDAATDAIRKISRQVRGAIVGAGRVVSEAHIKEAASAGAAFLSPPGLTPTLLDALLKRGLPFLAGVSTSSDVVALLERGVTAAKLFPSEAIDAHAALRAFSGPFPQMRFCPTGGVSQERAADYLALPNVACVAGSWIAPPRVIYEQDWVTVEQRARAAATLGTRV